MIYAFSAYNLDGHRVMVLVDWKEVTEYPSAATQAAVENCDKHHFNQLNYCPVWAYDAYKVHRKWLELKAHIPFEIMFPFVVGESTVTKLKVARIVKDHDPFKAYSFQWGVVPKFVVRNSKLRESIPRHVGPGDSDYHIGRIAWMMHNPKSCSDPIDVYVSATRRLFVENGNHRLAAAWLRGDDEIAVRLYGHGIYAVGEMVGM